MGFWVFMLLSVLLIPVIMLIFGTVFSKTAPKDINYIFGYRTARSMKNEDTWKFAHCLLGKIWKRCGLVTLVFSVVPMLFVFGKSKDTIGNVGLVIIYAQLLLLLLTIVPVEKALKENFDKDGNRKE